MNHAAAAAFILAGLAALAYTGQVQAAPAGEGSDAAPDYGGDPLAGILDFAPAGSPAAPAVDAAADAGNGAAGDFSAVFDMLVPTVSQSDNRAAFLAMIRQSECGTSGPDAYTMLVGGRRFSDLSKHPHVYVKEFNSTAAGAYQINWPTWQEIQAALHLPDFSPQSQDDAARWLLQKSGALARIDAGDFAGAVARAAPRWASLPGAGYGQHENTLASLQAAYTAAGGALA